MVRKRASARRRIYLMPMRSDNEFVNLFAEQVAAGGADVRPFSPGRALALLPSCTVVHWPDRLVRARGPLATAVQAARVAAWIAIRIATRSRIVWVVHNTKPHDTRVSPFLEQLFAWLVTDLIFISSASQEALREATGRIYAGKRRLVVRHGHYGPALRRLGDAAGGVRERVPGGPARLGFFGLVRRYKGLEALIEALAQRAPDVPIALRIVGCAIDPSYAHTLADKAAGVPDIAFRLERDMIALPDLVAEIRAMDGVVLPTPRILHSGAAMLALSLRKPILVETSLTMLELRREVGSEWVHLYSGRLDADDLARFARFLATGGPAGEPRLDRYDWDSIGPALRGFLDAPSPALPPRERALADAAHGSSHRGIERSAS